MSVVYKNSDECYTPSWVTDPLGPFDLDPCAGPYKNIATVNYRLHVILPWSEFKKMYPNGGYNLWVSMQKGTDGINTTWNGFVWLNPPFKYKTPWINKLKRHNNGILLLPDRTPSPWFADILNYTGWVWFMGQKINFEGATSTNPMGTSLFPFGEEAVDRINKSGLPGFMVKKYKINFRDF